MWGSLYFQNSVSFVMEQLIFFHDYIMMVLLGVMVLVGYFLGDAIVLVGYNRGIHEGQRLEGVWTVIPGVVLLAIVYPSLKVLYYMEEGSNVDLLIKVTGKQWFWSYEYFGVVDKMFDSYMSSKNSLFRLLDSDSWMLVPFNLGVRVVITSMDVIHSWTVPSLGVKSDAVPGRLNQVFVFFNRPGTFLGQCSEICGSNHSFMPVVVGSISCMDFTKWCFC